MSALIIVIVVLLAGVAALVLYPWRDRRALSRDALNRTLYYSRLRELDEEPPEAREALVVELQHSLLADIPEPRAQRAGHAGYGPLLAGVLLVIAVSGGLFMATHSLKQVNAWQAAARETPSLVARVMDPHAAPLTMDELTRLGLGLRTRLQEEPRNAAGWAMLGRIGMVLNNADTATDAFKRAWQLNSQSTEARLDYAEVLARSAQPDDNRLGEQMLKAVAAQAPDNLRAQGLLAFSAFRQQRYPEAIAIWQAMLTRLPPDDARRAAVLRGIQQARVDSGMDNARLAVKITLSPVSKKALPDKGILFVSVTDGVSGVPVLVKKLPLGHFPLTIMLDDADAMLSERGLEHVTQGIVKVHISRDGNAAVQPGDWTGERRFTTLNPASPVDVLVAPSPSGAG
ncbi:c-type cytochrome biogenesis protein CcmI [Cronobacter turicensis]|uniref:c-type cytochrome biogenesis protein CcmI n=1 Tax=Cronobacter turicensis TaxID=413502 RepID=UPI0024AF1D02|nr:c-type cytochrome biogenesis protein CcmI [Cronobacter turicensis]MDI7406650.1 c-type cytochrome biogenesis protein CcmI [Cronobacter turicensis]